MISYWYHMVIRVFTGLVNKSGISVVLFKANVLSLKLGINGASCPSSISIVNMCSWIHCIKQKQNKTFADFKKNKWIFNIFKNQILLEASFWKIDHPQTFHKVTRGPTQNLGPIVSDILKFIEYKQTRKVYIFICIVYKITPISWYIPKSYIDFSQSSIPQRNSVFVTNFDISNYNFY